MKYKNIGAYKNLINIGYCRATADIKPGMGIVLDEVAKTATPATTTTGKTTQFICANINDKPEIWNNEDFVVKKGETVRADDLAYLDGQDIEFAHYEVKDIDTIAVGDNLVFGANGILEKATATTGYSVYFVVKELTGYMGDGVLAKIIVD